MHERSSPRLAVFGIRDGKLPMGVLRIRTDEGIEGAELPELSRPGPEAIAHEIVTFVKPLLLGEDPLEIGRHWRRLATSAHFINPITMGVVDVALWDIAGQAAGLPIHRLLGTCRDRLPVYFSSATTRAREDTPRRRSTGASRAGRGYKLHPPRAPWRADDAAADLVRHRRLRARSASAVGDDDGADARRDLELLLRRGAARRPRDRGARLPLVRGPAAGATTSTATAGSSSTCGSRCWRPR